MIYFAIIFEITVLLFLGITFFFLGWPLIATGAPFLPSYPKKKRYILDPLFKAIREQSKGNKFVDLGSGDGRLVIEFAKQGFESTGIEFNHALTWWSRFKIKKLKLNNAKIIRGDFWKFNLGNFDVIYIYQLNYVNALLAEKFKKELKPGAIIISAAFLLFGFELVKKEGMFWIYKN